jgi:hypothetical protein
MLILNHYSSIVNDKPNQILQGMLHFLEHDSSKRRGFNFYRNERCYPENQQFSPDPLRECV